MWKTLAFTAISFFCSIGTASACGLNEIVSGLCHDAFGVLEDAHAGDRAAIVKKYAWTNLAGVKDNGVIELRICAFVSPAPVVSSDKKKLILFDYSKNKQRWKSLMKKIETQAQQWNEPQQSALGGIRTSRLRFIFRQDSGEFRACEDFPNSHIRISFVKNANFSVYGMQAWTHQLNASSKVQASMALQPNAIEWGRGTVQHEFGHALGFVHEMHHPRWKECSQDFDLKLYLKDNPNLYPSAKDAEQMEQMAKKNMLESEFGEKQLASTYEFDTKSIMTYVIPSKYFDNKDCAFPKDIAKIAPGDYSKFLDVYAFK